MNIAEIFGELEIELLKNTTHSLSTGNWRSQRMKAFKEFQARNSALLSKYDIDGAVAEKIKEAYIRSGKVTESGIQKAIEAGHIAEKNGTAFSVNDAKLNTLIQASQSEARTVATAALRMTDDVYRRTMVKSEIALSSNLFTLNKCIDMSVKDFAAAGINCIQYANGARVNIASYAEMALRTSSRRATLLAEGAVREDWGESLVYVSQYGACSPICQPWQGRVYVDDVYSNGKPRAEYPLLSEAVSNGLFHPNCRHKSNTWFDDLNDVPPVMDQSTVERNSALEAKQRYNERQIRKYKRLEECALDPSTKKEYSGKVNQWQSKQRQLIGENSKILRRDYPREQTHGIVNEQRFVSAAEPVKVKKFVRSEYKTIEEAKEGLGEFAEKVLGQDAKNLDSMNDIHGQLKYLQDKYPTKKLKTLDLRKGGSYGSVDSQGDWLRMNLNGTMVNTPPMVKPMAYPEGWAEYNQKRMKGWEELVEKYTKAGDVDGLKYVQMTVDDLNRNMKYTRHNVIYRGAEVRSVTTHEYAHILTRDYLDRKLPVDPVGIAKRGLVEEVMKRAKADGDTFKISMYSESALNEFFSEVFTVKEMGIETLPKYISDMIEEVLK